MASGRRDYWLGVSPEKSVFGLYQTPFWQSDADDVTATSDKTLISYVVPAGYILHINSAVITCDHPGIQRCALFLGAAFDRYAYYDTLYSFPFNGDGVYPIAAGGVLSLVLTNMDGVTAHFRASVAGFLELLTV